MTEPIKLLALDLDGTLALENNEVSPATQKALYELQHENGIEVVIATGRRYRGSRYVIDNLGFDVFCVCCDGALVKDPEQKTLLESSFSREEIVFIVSAARQLDIALVAQRDSHTYGGSDFLIDSQVSWCKAVNSYFKNNRDFSRPADLLGHDDQFLLLGGIDEDLEKLTEFARLIQNDPQDRFHVITVPFLRSTGFYCGVTLKHVTKWYGLEFLASALGITGNNICAVGDQLNDMAMIQAAGLGVAMGNANPVLKQAAQMVCGNYDEDGLLEVIHHIREINA